MKKILNHLNARKLAVRFIEDKRTEFRNPYLLFQNREGIKKMGAKLDEGTFKTLKEAKEFYNITPEDNCIVIQECKEEGDREYYDSLKD